MLNAVDFYYFSPTGGTYRAAKQLCEGLAERVKENNLSGAEIVQSENDLTVVAAPVFGGRIPAIVVEKLQQIKGDGKKAVALAVYGNRAYEDALLELTDVLKDGGFQVIAAAALLAQHSIVPALAEGRPDERDGAEIEVFAKKILEKLKRNATSEEEASASIVAVPGNYPYKERSGSGASPIIGKSCCECGNCINICPVGAIHRVDGRIETDSEKCILCMACVAKCPRVARKLPEALQMAMNKKLQEFAEIRRENEFFL